LIKSYPRQEVIRHVITPRIRNLLHLTAADCHKEAGSEALSNDKLPPDLTHDLANTDAILTHFVFVNTLYFSLFLFFLFTI
jgi:hypothetical protein